MRLEYANTVSGLSNLLVLLSLGPETCCTEVLAGKSAVKATLCCIHASRLVKELGWTSKLGAFYKITHPRDRDSPYGNIVVHFKEKAQGFPISTKRPRISDLPSFKPDDIVAILVDRLKTDFPQCRSSYRDRATNWTSFDSLPW